MPAPVVARVETHVRLTPPLPPIAVDQRTTWPSMPTVTNRPPDREARAVMALECARAEATAPLFGFQRLT
jgi:hypothetical protein